MENIFYILKNEEPFLRRLHWMFRMDDYFLLIFFLSHGIFCNKEKSSTNLDKW